MKIVSLTLSDNQEDKIADALKSVLEHVDECVVIDTGITDGTLKNAADVAGEKLHITTYFWTSDFSDARNFALSVANERGADWALMLDSDERYTWNGFDLRSFLVDCPETAHGFLLRDRGEGYAKEHLFKIPVEEKYRGKTHEAFPTKGFVELPTVRTWELRKARQDFERKLGRDLAILRSEVDRSPSARNHFYLGQTQKNLGLISEAVESFRHSIRIGTWDEQSAWASYCLAQCLTRLGAHRKAIEACALGLAHHAEFPELPWYAARLSYKLGDYQQAARWARMAIALAQQAVKEPVTPFIGFSEPLARLGGADRIATLSYEQLSKKLPSDA